MRNHKTLDGEPHEFYRWDSVTKAAKNALSLRYQVNLSLTAPPAPSVTLPLPFSAAAAPLHAAVPGPLNRRGGAQRALDALPHRPCYSLGALRHAVHVGQLVAVHARGDRGSEGGGGLLPYRSLVS